MNLIAEHPGLLIPLILAYVGFNIVLSNIMVRCISHPKYSLNISDDEFSFYTIIIMFIGLPILLFYKQLRRRRMREYFEYVISNEKQVHDFGVICGIETSKEELFSIKRKMKLMEINRKIKKKRKLISFK